MKYDLKELVETYGAPNLVFRIPMAIEKWVQGAGVYFFESHQQQPTLCQICEERYQVTDGHKITLTPCDALESEYPFREHFYINDLESLLANSPDFELFVQDVDGYTRIQ